MLHPTTRLRPPLERFTGPVKEQEGIVEKAAKGTRIGMVGVVLLLVSYVRLFGFRFLSPGWSIAILVLSTVAVIIFISAGLLSSKWWYCGALFGILSAFFVFAFAWG